MRSIGVSNYSIELLEDLTDEVDETPAVNQIEWSPFGHSRRMLDYCTSRRIAIQAYSPLTRGERLDDPQLDAIAQRYGRTPAQVILRWDLQLGVAPLPKANRRDHLEENIRAFEFELSDDDMSALSALNEGYSALGELAYT